MSNMFKGVGQNVEMFNLEDAILASFGREETDNDLNLAL